MRDRPFFPSRLRHFAQVGVLLGKTSIFKVVANGIGKQASKQLCFFTVFLQLVR